MGNRIKEGKCIMCGFTLLVPNEWNCCNECIPKIKAMVLDIKSNPGNRPKKRTRLIRKGGG